MSNTVKESVVIDLQTMKASCKNGVSTKGARKVIQDCLKELTPFQGYWTVWFDSDDGERYIFKLDNPLLDFYKASQV